jgi:hypothetical protein
VNRLRAFNIWPSSPACTGALLLFGALFDLMGTPTNSARPCVEPGILRDRCNGDDEACGEWDAAILTKDYSAMRGHLRAFYTAMGRPSII